jgi:hypothetical protein
MGQIKMAYKIKQSKVRKKKGLYSEKDEQRSINHLLFFKNKAKDTEPKLLTIIVKKEKEHHFAFLRNETEFEVAGKWHSKGHKLFQEENSEIEIVFYDDKDNTKSNLLMSKLKDYNRKYIKEQVLYTTISSINKTSI